MPARLDAGRIAVHLILYIFMGMFEYFPAGRP